MVDYYQETVRPDHGPEGAVNNVVKLLKQGRDEDMLRRCTDGFAARCRQRDTESTFRMKARNFFGKDEGYKAYIGYQPGAVGSGNGNGRHVESEEESRTRVEADRERARREREEAQRAGGMKGFADALRAGGVG